MSRTQKSTAKSIRVTAKKVTAKKITAKNVAVKKATKVKGTARAKIKPTGEPVVGIVMGSDTDLGFMIQAAEALEKFSIPFEIRIVSAHRTPDLVMAYGGSARSRGIRVIIAGAGGAAHLPGMMAAHTTIPVIGVPVPIGPLQGVDALHSIVQMPKGVPVATMSIGGAWNAGVFAAQILGLGMGSESLRVGGELGLYKQEMEDAVAKMNANL